MKKILSFIRTAFSNDNYFRTCILIFAAIITVSVVCASCSIIGLQDTLDHNTRDIEYSINHIDLDDIRKEISSVSTEISSVGTKIAGIQSELSDIDAKLSEISGLKSELSDISSKLSDIDVTLLRR